MRCKNCLCLKYIFLLCRLKINHVTDMKHAFIILSPYNTVANSKIFLGGRIFFQDQLTVRPSFFHEIFDTMAQSSIIQHH
jgi:hypothetical protein